MQGTDMWPSRGPARDQSEYHGRRGHHTAEEIDALHAIGVDAVVGMAIYSGVLALD